MKLLKKTQLELGSGGQGRVVTYGHKLACKILKKSPEAYKEIMITQRVQGIPGVAKLYDIDEDDAHLYMIMDKYYQVQSIDDVKDYTKSILLSISQVHDRNIIHNDLKQQNVMQDDHGNYILIDFGCSIYSDLPTPPLTLTTPSYCSVESLSSRNCKKSDMWSLGVMIYKEILNTYPFDGPDYMTIFRQIINKNLDFELIKNRDARDFIQRLLERDVEKRMSAREAMNHDWLITIGQDEDEPKLAECAE